jgi:hypothetical protein
MIRSVNKIALCLLPYFEKYFNGGLMMAFTDRNI